MPNAIACGSLCGALQMTSAGNERRKAIPSRLWQEHCTLRQSGVNYRSTGRSKTEIPVFNQLTGLIQTGGHDTLFPSSDVGLVAASDHYEVRCLSIVGALVRASGTRVADDVEIRL